MGDQELEAFVAELVAQGESPDVINSVIDQWDTDHPAGPKPLGPPNQHTATSEEFTKPSFGGFVNNVVNDAKGVLGSFNPMNWPDMARAKQAAEDEALADLDREMQGQRAFSLPGDRLAKQLQGIPGVLYDSPVQSALALAPMARPTAAAVGRAVPGVISGAKAVAKSPVTKAVVKGAADVGTLGTVGRVFEAVKDVRGAMKPAASHAPATAQGSLAAELLKREPDWRTVDAVPINAMKAKGIIEPGESRVGLSEAAAAADKAGNAAEVARLLKALRQRQHISAKR